MDHRTDPPDQLTLIEASIPVPPAWILLLRGAVNGCDEEELRAVFTRALAHPRVPLIVDLGSLEHADAFLLGLLLVARTRTRLHLVGPLSRSFKHRLDVTGTPDFFRVHATLTDALAAVTAADARGGGTTPPLPGQG
ncbi:hypothetical protein ACIRO3_26485 [Streptomyces sp. NPDC102278]|uniref:hypothetical protein n=1 Tax=Streptomyces sp. NPDC102278 TaxID=3366152 RepID=UPI00382C8CA8